VKKTSIWCLIGFVLLQVMSAARFQAQTTAGTDKAVAALEEQWLQSQKTNNPDLVAPLLADNFTSTSSDGKVYSKAEFLATQKSIKWRSAETNDVKVTVFGDTAIAIGSEKLKGADASGKTLDLNERWTDTWVKMPSGKWQCVATHQSPIKM
jgi:ketosteroid isomerase-like protein